MRRPDKAHSKAAKKQRRKTSSPRAPKAALRRGPVTIGKETNVARLSRELSEASEQQAATAEILSVISNSPTDTQPVFESIVQSGLKLFPGALVSVAQVRRHDQRRGRRRAGSCSRRSVATHNFPYPPRAQLHARRSLA
jgi:hypothetical protein